ncbi:MAG: hypothetical protein NTV35_13690 [Chloroflexi bacterium]|nr:hypothetical protein [Chloroflexota bacterium]
MSQDTVGAAISSGEGKMGKAIDSLEHDLSALRIRDAVEPDGEHQCS